MQTPGARGADDLLVRPAEPTDTAEVAALWRAAGLAPGRVAVEDQVGELLRHDAELVLVACTGPALVGSLLGAFDGRRGWVNRLAVHPDHQGTGVGAALLASFERRLAERGCRKVNLLITPNNTGVEGFYARHGFTQAPLTFMEKWLD